MFTKMWYVCMFWEFFVQLINDSFLKSEAAHVDQDIQKEYSRQREHLEKTVTSLKYKLAKDTEIHKADNIRTMQVSQSLTRHLAVVINKFFFVSDISIGKRDFNQRSKRFASRAQASAQSNTWFGNSLGYKPQECSSCNGCYCAGLARAPRQSSYRGKAKGATENNWSSKIWNQTSTWKNRRNGSENK